MFRPNKLDQQGEIVTLPQTETYNFSYRKDWRKAQMKRCDFSISCDIYST